MTPPPRTTRDDLVLGIFGALDGFPISTRDVATLVGAVLGHRPGVRQPWVLGVLHRLAGAGHIERWHPLGSRSYYWRR